MVCKECSYNHPNRAHSLAVSAVDLGIAEGMNGSEQSAKFVPEKVQLSTSESGINVGNMKSIISPALLGGIELSLQGRSRDVGAEIISMVLPALLGETES